MPVQLEMTVNGQPLTESTQREIRDKVDALQESTRRLKVIRVSVDWKDSQTPCATVSAWTKSLAAHEVESFKPDIECSESHDSVLLAVNAALQAVERESQLDQPEEAATAKGESSFANSPATLVALGLLTLLVVIFYTLPSAGRGTVPVEGVVTFEGEPLADANVIFNPQNGTVAATGKTDRQGRFKLSSFDPGDGAFPGPYVVTIVVPPILEDPITPMEEDFDKSIEEDMARQAAEERGQETKMEYRIPPTYSNPTQSPLKVTVPHEGPVVLKLTKSGSDP